jgi:RHS repeat-associated protein
MPGRTYSSNNLYRYGFNGKENDNEVKGEGNQQDYGDRILDTRLGGHWFSLDPLQKKRPGESPYLYTGGNPILFVDVDGKDRIKYYVFIDEKTGTVLRSTGKIINERDLKSVHNVYYQNSSIVENWDWYDVKEIHYVIKHQNGTITNSTVETAGRHRTTTTDGVIFKGQWWANLVKDNTPHKEPDVPNGIVMTSSEGGREGSKYNKGAKHIDGVINIDLLMETIDGFKGSADISLEKSENKILDVLENINTSTSAISIWKTAVEKVKERQIEQCESCRAFKQGGKEIDTTGKGIKPNDIKQVPIKKFHQ